MNSRPPHTGATYACAHGQTRRVFVRDLQVMASIGVHDYEKRNEQGIIVSVDLMVRDDYDGKSDELGHVLDYSAIVEIVHKTIEAEHIHLIETLAERIAQGCLSDKSVLRVRVKIEKPDPFPAARSVGIEIERLQPE